MNAARALWECRYFVSEVPERFGAKGIAGVFPQSEAYSAADEDIYVITDDMTRNVKVRRRRREIKAKVLLGIEGDGFQLWQTELEHPLPAPIPVWRTVLSLMKASGDARFLSGCADADGVAEALQSVDAKVRLVRVGKSRVSYRLPFARFEVVQVRIGNQVVSSVEFEAADLAEARLIREELSAHDLGVPDSYVRLCSRTAFGDEGQV